MRLNQTSKLLHSNGNHKEDEKASLRMGENICKQSNRQKTNLQNTQTAYGAQYKKKNPNQKMDGRPKDTFLPRKTFLTSGTFSRIRWITP